MYVKFPNCAGPVGNTFQALETKALEPERTNIDNIDPHVCSRNT